MRSIDGRSVSTFHLVWCERCGHAQEPGAFADIPDFVADAPLVCTDCGEGLTLIECFVKGKDIWSRPGQAHQYVAHISDLKALA